ncbi:hypothetical protein P389DRAFT_35529 [Cystobasidium minutum MCA 4210]|uniref:uncharacterized protein n=1 Tax=Cystobasidium minutum MCA 4210 TaxID=1397322 RepID=UPI0034CFE3DA|eukprot:jgi/Rhomi1/35529/CE35528_28
MLLYSSRSCSLTRFSDCKKRHAFEQLSTRGSVSSKSRLALILRHCIMKHSLALLFIILPSLYVLIYMCHVRVDSVSIILAQRRIHTKSFDAQHNPSACG